jgi:hypothetical protein
MKKYILLFGLLATSLFGSMSLNVFEAQFEQAYKEGQFKTILENRAPQETNLRAQQKFNLEVQKLQEERNKALLNLSGSDSEMSQLIRRIAEFRLTPLQAEAIQYLDSLKYKPLNSSNSPLENQLIAIDAQYECKKLYAEMLFTQKKLTLVEKKGMQVVFKIEKMHQMMEAANKSNEHSIGRLVEEADQILGSYQNYRSDLAALEALAKRTASDADPLAAQVKEIELDYQTKLQELQAKFLIS